MGANTHTTRPLPLRITVVYNNVTQTPAEEQGQEEQGQVLQSSNCVNLKDRLAPNSCHTNFTHLSQQRVDNYKKHEILNGCFQACISA